VTKFIEIFILATLQHISLFAFDLDEYKYDLPASSTKAEKEAKRKKPTTRRMLKQFSVVVCHIIPCWNQEFFFFLNKKRTQTATERYHHRFVEQIFCLFPSVVDFFFSQPSR
jgi:hypothetical protein